MWYTLHSTMRTPRYAFVYYMHGRVYVLIAIVFICESTHIMQHGFSDRIRVRHGIYNNSSFLGLWLMDMVMVMEMMVVSFSGYQQRLFLVHMLYHCLWLYK